MTDRELFQKTRKNLPSLALPVFGTLLAEVLVKALISAGLARLIELESMRPVGPRDPLAYLVQGLGLLLLFGVEVALDLLILGAVRLCLARGEGKKGTMPWTILSQWRWYLSWVLWPLFLSGFWNMGVRILSVWLGYRMTDMEFAQWNLWRFYGNIVWVLVTLFLVSLLRLSVQTAYLRAPERGFWRAVGFGLKEGLQKWPRTIGAQLKFVVPVSLAVSWITVFLSNLAFRTGGSALSSACRLINQLLSLLGQTWTLVLYGHLAAERYDPPGQRTGPEEVSEEPEKSAAARFAEGLIGKPFSPFPGRREMKLIRGGPWYYRNSKKGPMIPGPLERK